MNAARRIVIFFCLGFASCAPTGDHDRMQRMRKEEVVPVLEAALEPLLLKAGLERKGERWSLRRGDAIWSVEFGADSRTAVLRAGIGFVPARDLIQTAPSNLDLSFGTIPASELLQLYLYQDQRNSGGRGPEGSGLFWEYKDLTADALAESVTATFRAHVLPFFEATSTVEAALHEVGDEGRYGDCGPMSRFEPRINKFHLAALCKQRGDRKRALEVVEKQLAIEHPQEPWRVFREWILRP